jgi:hydrogenase nickel incorporation protein HypA/HybF
VHELSIAHGIVDVVTEAARAAGAQTVTAVHLRIGRLAGVEAGALEFSYELVTEGTLLAGSRLVVEELPVVIYCATCRADRTLPGVQRFRCPTCDTPSGEIRQGRELEVGSIEIGNAQAVPA